MWLRVWALTTVCPGSDPTSDIGYVALPFSVPQLQNGSSEGVSGPRGEAQESGRAVGTYKVLRAAPWEALSDAAAPIATATVASLLLHQRAKELNPSGADQRRALSVASA